MSHPMPPEHRPGRPMSIGRPAPTDPEPNIRYGNTVTNVDMGGRVLVDAEGNPADPGQHGTYILPPGAAARAREQAEEVPGPTATDDLAKDAVPPSYPEGCPEFTPLTALDFEQRAEAFDLLDEIQEIGSDVPKKGTQVTAKQAAKMYRVLSRMNSFLRFVAVDQQAWDDWPGRKDDAQFSQAWAAYQAGAQPGEAASSSS